MHVDRLNRRNFTALFGGALAWPLGASAQDPTMPVIGFLNSASPDPAAKLLDEIPRGTAQRRLCRRPKRRDRVEGGRTVNLRGPPVRGRSGSPPCVTDRRDGGHSVGAASYDRHRRRFRLYSFPDLTRSSMGLVASFNRPCVNLTGVAVQTSELMSKRLQLLSELVPRIATIALLVNPNRRRLTKSKPIYVEAATRTAGQQMVLLKASLESEYFEPAFASAIQQRADALLVSANPFFTDRRSSDSSSLAARHSNARRLSFGANMPTPAD